MEQPTERPAGRPEEIDDLLPLVYDKLRRLAAAYLRGERAGHTLQPTALVHEAWLRLAELRRIDWRDRTHFFAMAARQMRRVLIEHARAAGSAKRGGGVRPITLHDGDALAEGANLELLALDEALAALARLSERQARVAELRLFGGLQVDETARVLGVSERTVKADWRVGRAWLARELRADRAGG